MSGYCQGCGRTDMAGITHVCPPPVATHVCNPPTIVGLTVAQQPDWTCGICGRVWRDWPAGALRWWAEVRGPS